jgi:hypothetical protein
MLSTAARRLHQCERVAGYMLGAAVFDSDGEAAAAALLTGKASDGVEARMG